MLHQIFLFCKKSGFRIEFMFLEFNKSSFQIHQPMLYQNSVLCMQRWTVARYLLSSDSGSAATVRTL